MNLVLLTSVFNLGKNIYHIALSTDEKSLALFLFLALLPIFIFLEAISLFKNLFPSRCIIDGTSIENDGLCILSALKTNYKRLLEEEIKNKIKVIYSRYKCNNYLGNVNFLSNYLRLLNNFMTAELLLKQRGSTPKGIKLFLEILKSEKISNPEKAYILDILAGIVIFKGDKRYLKDAEIWSLEALNIANDSKTLRGTRGAILIELGRYEEGKKLLSPLTEAKNELLDVAISCCYLAKAEYFLGNIDKVNTWLTKVKKINNSSANSILRRIQQEICYGL